MPEHLKALIVIIALASGVFLLGRTHACSVAIAPDDFKRRRNLWFAITLVAFLAHNFWVYIIVTAIIVPAVFRRERNTLAGFYFVLFAVPTLSGEISGLGIINQFFTIDYIRLLSLTVLLPAFVSLIKQKDVEKFGSLIPDKLIIGYGVLQFALILTASSFTNTLRVGIFYAFIDVFLPYYVASRSVRSVAGFRDVLMSYAVAATVLAVIGAYEFSRHWLLYTPLQDVFGIVVLVQSYLGRGESLRAMGSAGHAIAMGYIMAVAMGFFAGLKNALPNNKGWLLGWMVLAVGIVVPVSRGPWVGVAAMGLVFAATGPLPGRTLVRIGLMGVIAMPLILLSPLGSDLIDRLPFIGTADTESVTYRQRLLEISMLVIMQNPFFGAFDYFYSPAIQELKQGQGIIDIVNTYLGIALSSGLVGLTLFAGIFATTIAGIFSAMRADRDKSSETYLLGRVLLSVMVGIQIIIFTVSSISFIPVIYWTVAGLGVSYARMLVAAKSGVDVRLRAGHGSMNSAVVAIDRQPTPTRFG